jgi:hypothetical protein
MEDCYVTCHRFFPSIRLLFLIFWVSLASGNARAQDSHYWDNQYGTKAELLGGLVVGSSTDLSATYYNPGWIALQKGPSVLLTTKAAEVYTITLKNRLGRGTDPSSTIVTPSPGYLAGRFSLGNDYGWKWAYTYLQKVNFEFDASGRRIDHNPAAPPPGNIGFSGEAFRVAKVNESWYGISLSRKLTDKLAIGLSPYIAQRNQRSRFQSMAQALDSNYVFSDAYLVEEYKFWHVRMLVKIGLALEEESWTAGLTITTPSLSILGDGSVYQNASFSGDYNPANPGVDNPYLQANYQEDLAAVWKSPLSVAGGGAVNLGQTRIHFTAEWFNSIPRYKVVEPAPYEILSQPGNFDQFEMEYAAISLINFGVGVDHTFTKDFSLFTSYRLDRLSEPEELRNNLTISAWDLSHVSGGASFSLLNLELTAGLQYSWGDGLSDRFLNFNGDENGDVIGQYRDQEITFRRLKALLGFNLPFGISEEYE